MIISFKARNSLRCSNCGNSLSIFPIHCEDENKTFTCGRCPLMQTSIAKQIRQTAYEELAQFISFPCKFREQGCIEYHVPSVLVKHENLCGHRTYFCPLLSPKECGWTGPYYLLYNHYLESHQKFATENLDVKIHLNQTWENRCIFWNDTKLFLAHIRHHAGQHAFYLCVKHLEPSEEGQSHLYKVCLSNNKKQLYEYPMRPITNNADSFDAFLKSWKLQKNSCVSVTIKIVKLENETPPTQDLLRKIECSACFNDMVPPIFQCLTGHSICTNCNQENDTCPTCQEPIGDTRNFMLEEFTRLVKYPCKYQQGGCNFTTSRDEIKDHETNCKHGPFACPIRNCQWKKQVLELTKHLRTNHPKDLFNEINSVTFHFTRGVPKCFTSMASAYGVIFRLYFIYNGTAFFWSVQTVDAVAASYRYVFELQIVNESGEKILVRKICSPLTRTDQALTEGNSYVRLVEDSVKEMIEENTLVFYVNIIKQMCNEN